MLKISGRYLDSCLSNGKSQSDMTDPVFTYGDLEVLIGSTSVSGTSCNKAKCKNLVL